MCRRTHGCGLWRRIHEGWESLSKHLSFVVGDGTPIRFWHDRWIGDNTLKDLYPELYVCSAAKDACISEVLWIPKGSTIRVWDLRFEMQLLPLSLGREFGKLRFLKGWLFLCGQQPMVRF